jgi:four helix bundle protein
MNSDQLAERLWDFAARTAAVVEAIPDTRVGRHVAGQLIRSGTSPAPNYDEACAAESRADFIHKLSVCLKETRESRGWLRFVIKVKLLPSAKVAPLAAEAHELACILAKSIVTAKSRRQGQTANPI